MAEFNAIATLADLNCLDQDEILAGYRDGWSCSDEPGSDKSRGYWHGWRNAQIDKGRLPSDPPSQQLAGEYVRSLRAH